MEERRWTVHGLQTVSPPHGWSESAGVTLACLCCISTVLIHELGLVSDGHEKPPWPNLGAHLQPSARSVRSQLGRQIMSSGCMLEQLSRACVA